jgi:hypothetical protein
VREYFGDGAAGKLKLGLVCAFLLVACGGCFQGCPAAGPPPKFSITGPYVKNADGSLTAVSTAEAGKPYVFVIDRQVVADGTICPSILYWYLDSQGGGPTSTVHPPKTRVLPGAAIGGRDRCEVVNETITYTFAPGAPSRSVPVVAQMYAKFTNGQPFGVQPPSFAEAGSSYGKADAAMYVTVVTPGATPPSPTVSFGGAQSFNVGARASAVAAANLKSPATDEVVAADDEVAAGDQDRLYVYTPNAATVLAGPQIQTLDPGDDPRDIAAADFDGDGDQDLAVANFKAANGAGADEVQLLDNQGTNGAGDVLFGENSIITPQGTTAVAVGELNRDTDQGTGNPEPHPDIVAANSVSNTVSVAMNSGDPTPGTFQTPDHLATGGTSPSGVATGDFNNDGLDDIAVANTGSNNVHVLRNTGPPPVAPGPAATFAAPEEVLPAVANRSPQGVAVGDFNKDGLDDLAVANNGLDTISVLINTSATNATDLTFTEKTLPATGADPTGDAPRDLTVGDFNADGFDDLATANTGSDNASAYAGDGKGVFSAPVHVAMGDMPYSIAAGTLNGDGRDDLAVANFGNPPTTQGNLTVALAQATSARRSEAQHADAPKGAKHIKITGRFSRARILSYGRSSFDDAGIGHLKHGLFSARLKARAKPKRDLPEGFGRRLVADVVARLDVDIYPEADLLPPTVLRGLLVGRVRKDPETVVCLRTRMDSRDGMEAANKLKFVGATGAVAGLRGKGTFDEPPTLEDALDPNYPKWGDLDLAAREGKPRRLPLPCKALVKRLPG